jgi:type IV secretory pathway VirB10-like protein
MAKKNLGRLAGLAALAGAAYMASKGKDKDDAGDQKTSSYTGDTKKVEDKEEPRRQITDYMKKSDGDSKPITEADVVMPEKAAPAAPKKPTPPRAPTTDKTDPRINSTRRDLEAGMSRGMPAKQKPVIEGVKPAEDMKNYKPRRPVPTPPFKGGQPGYDEAGNFLGGRRGYDEAGNPMKKGGKVKKMASGGMTVSKRADGIASRGKTKCKMY